MVSEYELIILVLILGIVIFKIIKLIIDETINYIIGGIIFLFSMWIISLILNHFGFTILADLLDYIVSLPANYFEHLKAKITN